MLERAAVRSAGSLSSDGSSGSDSVPRRAMAALAKALDGFVDAGRGLFAEYAAEQHAERTDIAAQRRGGEVAGRRGEFSEALRPGGRKPERRHDRLWHLACLPISQPNWVA